MPTADSADESGHGGVGMGYKGGLGPYAVRDHPPVPGQQRPSRPPVEASASALQVHRVLMEHPIATSGWLVEKTGITPATVNKSLGHLEQLGIVKELTSRKRNRLFSYAGYIEIMSSGTELPGR